MPRPVSWLLRLPEIRRAVQASARSHYERRDIERLFELQPRAAGALIEMMPGEMVGTSRILASADLVAFLNQVDDASSVPALLDMFRSRKPKVTRRKLRDFEPAQLPPLLLNDLPQSVKLTRRFVSIDFDELEDLLESMLAIARAVETEPDQFRRIYARKPPQPETSELQDFRRMAEELEQMELRKAGTHGV